LKDTALAIIGLNSLSEELWSVDDDRAFEYDLLGEVRAYAHRNGICVHEAIIRLVNSALSHREV
jgi:hypothetical protein